MSKKNSPLWAAWNHPKDDSYQDQIVRVNEITKTARGVWFGLLSYLSFVSLALMGVRDVDFFLTDKETTLPLVGVDVPTFVFFAVAPGVGFVVYAYFQMHLLKLWEALDDLPGQIKSTPLSDHIQPWLVTDIALSQRSDGALRERPLRRWSFWINVVFAFAGAPLILTAFWYRSFPPHIDWLTLFACGLPMIGAWYVAWTGWVRLRQLARGHDGVGLSRRLNRVAAIGAVLLSLVGWFRVEGTVEHYLTWADLRKPNTDPPWYWSTPFPQLLYPANLEGANFAGVPDDWVDRDTYRRQYRATWCGEVGLSADVCGAAPDLDGRAQPRVARSISRKGWCAEQSQRSGESIDCAAVFDDFEGRFEAAWLNAREAEIARLNGLDLSNADLRNANLQGAQLQGAVLFRAQLQGAVLSRAQLQGAVLRRARLQGAVLAGAQLQGADLTGAQLLGADLVGPQLQGADLAGAQLQGAVLF
ncbi:MAG: pentapeptide repeat-containing protein, partial [Pseudomonadota bacterium]